VEHAASLGTMPCPLCVLKRDVSEALYLVALGAKDGERVIGDDVKG
jgi:hypothetical protein